MDFTLYKIKLLLLLHVDLAKFLSVHGALFHGEHSFCNMTDAIFIDINNSFIDINNSFIDINNSFIGRIEHPSLLISINELLISINELLISIKMDAVSILISINELWGNVNLIDGIIHNHTKCRFSFAHLNVRSIMNKLDHFRILMSKKPFDVIMFERNVLR